MEILLAMHITGFLLILFAMLVTRDRWGFKDYFFIPIAWPIWLAVLLACALFMSED